ncbi:replication-associated recombination protein A [Clostridium luticellarii]|jgi:putative ATPase|uniref:Replication-associated recombination protein A n=1 Tax=Clostridium luticellarii TaxID=1691940 RepID=A0A2T0BM96_9CLOT|nr:replication-associated recombination protein A [Clostridium luticellarii]MCI1945196.1 replication-associated recombination protein A [Clostridium luticellarii]MCI1968842.1 replication-associated recombination protein A [Clostridium luticellarii]MCI1995628.1 replication-associated recombination protein A [Clostridium luticellarii]MCI2040016.1 replication-associated recombination protein A [Clostridium luticellarii]PRR85005.1 Replication-associated recombination protein A [Clostridium luticel
MDYVQNSMFDKKFSSPLAERVRPRKLEDYIGQRHILEKGKILSNLIHTDNISSMIFWGPPGVGKTTLAMIIASITKAKFINFSAATSGIKEIKEVMARAEKNRSMGVRTILFVDEIHRFNKAQQDAFLPHVEKGNIILIGATTENPSFEINSALLSRCRVFVLHPLDIGDIVSLLKRAIKDKRGFGYLKVGITDEILRTIAMYSNGDARCALNVLEISVMSCLDNVSTSQVTREAVEQCIGKKILLYDKNGEEHYNLISALHKSMRNSDVDASIYWLARILEAGEDPLYVARRIIRFSSEDVGMADPGALAVAVSAYNAVHFIGMPECSVNLTQAVVYMAYAPKSNSLYLAYNKAKKDALDTISQGVPMHLRNAPTKFMRDLEYGKGYKYAHDFKEKTTDMQCLPDNLKDRKYYAPSEQGFEKNVKETLNNIKDIKDKQKS